MKPTPLADQYLYIANCLIFELSRTTNPEKYRYVDSTKLNETYDFLDGIVNEFLIKDIKDEFWEVCEDYDKILPLKQVYEIKFKDVLNFRFKEFSELYAALDEVDREIKSFLQEYSRRVELTDDQRIRVFRSLRIFYYKITEFGYNLREMLNDFSEMGRINSNNMPRCKFKLSDKKKTDFIKLISAMYDNRMFETEAGYLVSNKQELMNEFGRVVNEDLSNYSVLLSKSKNPDKSVFLKPFKEIERKAEEYYDKES